MALAESWQLRIPPVLCWPGTRQRLPLSPACTSSQRPNVDGTFKEMIASQTGKQRCHGAPKILLMLQ